MSAAPASELPAVPRHGRDAEPGALLRSFLRDGVAVVEGFLEASACSRLARHADTLARELAGDDGPVFSTRTHEHAAADAFVESAAGMRVFYEEDAGEEAGRPREPAARAVNKIGHALHELDPAFAALSRGPALERVLRILGLADPVLLQSMLIFKRPAVGGEVVWHQDATFLYTDPVSVTGLWIALEDATVENGCLWLRPGAHRGPLRRLFADDGDGLALGQLDDTPWPDDEGEPLEVPAGTLVALHGLAPHRSAPNRSPRSRIAYALHAVDRRACYPATNWLQRDAANPARGFERRGVEARAQRGAEP